MDDPHETRADSFGEAVGYVRTAIDDDILEVRRILDAAMLEPGDVETRIAEGSVLVAGDERGGTTGTAERILGTVVLEPFEKGEEGDGSGNGDRGAHVGAIGVRRRHRGRGIGTALIDRAVEREGRLTARFDDGVRPFYERLGFSIEPIDEQRHRGVKVGRGLEFD
ncbi:GCN5-related N-acetyltransferase [Haloterrigena turkmenica DSM 5511]|uniref:GCN5-related N-acetyltransferase n=1 Tax=Haloterrigena turkmenica (strain ATCC 51198 / DSM 5511 / JCM 9101 / NCIMB 13204 / VKM B-1734 / 4k) TaxID=543526 RepID=D2RSU7_HALTV|nr:GNAT family N-acetyltransferase [Haloterrigena turkmenica]ADB58921.1 GCN5-related N-acetyltransferase [Haloterrigena turkmenica DSM 5511]